MSAYKRVVERLMILAVLTFGVFALAKPEKAFALTPCQQACVHDDLICQRACNTSQDPDCRIECTQNLQDCEAACG